jgi:hypothetical protein
MLWRKRGNFKTETPTESFAPLLLNGGGEDAEELPEGMVQLEAPVCQSSLWCRAGLKQEQRGFSLPRSVEQRPSSLDERVRKAFCLLQPINPRLSAPPYHSHIHSHSLSPETFRFEIPPWSIQNLNLSHCPFPSFFVLPLLLFLLLLAGLRRKAGRVEQNYPVLVT